MSDITLSHEEIKALTGGRTQPRRQVKRLKELGYWRAHLDRGKAVLERAHYEAVCAGRVEPGADPVHTKRPTVRPLLRRRPAAAAM